MQCHGGRCGATHGMVAGAVPRWPVRCRSGPCSAVVASAVPRVPWWPMQCRGGQCGATCAMVAHAVPWQPVRCHACHGGRCAAWWPSFQPHLAAAVPGPTLSPFLRRHIAVVASERTGCLISQLRREPPHFSKCCRKLCLFLSSSIPSAPGRKGLLGEVLSADVWGLGEEGW